MLYDSQYILQSQESTYYGALHFTYYIVLQFFPLCSPFFLHGQSIQITLHTQNLTTKKNIPTSFTNFGFFSVVKFCVYIVRFIISHHTIHIYQVHCVQCLNWCVQFMLMVSLGFSCSYLLDVFNWPINEKECVNSTT